jgi:hypothetical protein
VKKIIVEKKYQKEKKNTSKKGEGHDRKYLLHELECQKKKFEKI